MHAPVDSNIETPRTRTLNLPPTRASFPLLPDYEILEELGRGGMGVVYKARHRPLNRLVAIKMILAGNSANEEQRSRFMIEAEAVAHLQHANIVQLYEISEYEGRAFFALEYVPGVSLARYLMVKPLTPDEAVAILEPIVWAIHHAHERGILHRDLKPANILIAEPEPGASGTFRSASKMGFCDLKNALPKVADFGLAKQLFAVQDLTVSGMAIGTPNYMAPENALGNAKQMGLRSDIFSLGAILYEMLTGKPPFMGETPVQTMMKVVHEDPEPITRLQPNVPRDLTTICYRCLEKDPTRRYPNAKALAEDLQRFRAGKAIQARPIGQLEHIWKWAKRRPAPAALIALFILIGTLGVPGFATLWLQADDAREDEVKARVKADHLSQQERDAREQAEWKVYYSRIALARNEHQQNRVGDSNNQLQLCDPAKRGWEWDLLFARNHADLMTINDAFPAHVFDLAFSPDGSMLMAAGGDPFPAQQPGGTRVWAFPGGEELAQSPSLSPMHRSVGWMPDGRTAFFAANTGEIHRWDVKNKRISLFQRLEKKGNTHLAVSPDGTRLITMIRESDYFQIFDTSTGAETFRSSAELRGAECPTFSRDGQYFAFDTDDEHVRIHRADTGQLWKKIFNAGTRPRFHPSGKSLITVRGIAVIWDIETGKPKRNLGGEEGSVKAATFSPDGQHVATAGADGTVRLWSMDSGMVVTTFRGHRGRVNNVCFHPSGRYLASGGEQSADVKIWDLSRAPEHFSLLALGLGGEPQAICFDPSGERMLIASKGGSFCIKEVTTGQIQKHFAVEMSNVWMTPATQAEFSSDATKLATIGHRETGACLYDAATGEKLRTLSGDSVAKLFQVHWSGDGKRLVGNCREPVDLRKPDHNPRPKRMIFVWDAETGQSITTLTTQYLATRRLHGGAALNADGTLLAYDETFLDPASEKPEVGSQSIRIRHLASGEVIREIPLDAGDIVSTIQFSPDGNTLAVSFRNNEIRLWNLRTGDKRFDQPFNGPGTILAFRPDGRQLAGADRDQVKVWDLHAGVEALDLRSGRPRISDRGFNPQLAWGFDGRRLAVSNDSNDVSVWIAQEQHTPKGKADLYRSAEARGNTWHLRQAEKSLLYSNQFALEFHLHRLDARKIQDELELKLLRNITLDRGDLSQSLEIWKRLTQRELRDDFEHAARFGILALRQGDVDSYRATAKKLWKAYDGMNAAEKTFAGLLLVISPESGPQGEDWTRLTTHPIETWWPRAYWNQLIEGLAYYRAGRYLEAAESLEKATAKHQGFVNGAWRDLVLAMTYHHLDRNAEALESWKRGQSAMDANRADKTANALRKQPGKWEWWEWAVVEMVEREAAEVFGSGRP
jgi:WD40 repeat protein